MSHILCNASASSVLSKQLPLRLLLRSDGTLGAGAHPAGTQVPGAPRRWVNHSAFYNCACSRPCTHPDVSPSPDLFANGKPNQLEMQIAIWMSCLPISPLLRTEKCPCKGSVSARLLLLAKDLATGSSAFVTPLNNGNLTVTSATVPTSTGMHTTSFTPLDKNFQVNGATNSDKP